MFNNSWLRCFLAIAAIYFILLVYGSFNNPYIGHADRANAANVARNLVNGHGYVTDYIHAFYEDKELPAIEKTWPILQPTWIALSFKIFGINEISARLPNMFFIILIGIASFFIGKLLSNNYKVAFYCGLIALMCGRYDIQTRNETGAIFFITMIFLSVLLYERKRKIIWVIVTGILSGLAAMQRFELIIIFPILSFYFLINQFIVSKSKIKNYLLNISNYKNSIYVLIFSLVFYLPIMIYNYNVHGNILVSQNEASIMGYIAKYHSITPTAEERYAVYFNKNNESIMHNKNFVQKFSFNKSNLIELKKGIKYLIYKNIGIFGMIILFIGIFMNFSTIKDNKNLLLLLTLLVLAMLVAIAISTTFDKRYLWIFSPILISLSFSVLFERISKINKAITINKYYIILLPLILSISIFWGGKDRIINWITSSNIVISNSNKASYELINWINNNTLIDDIIMTREPWQINWHTNRSAIMVPYGDLNDFILICKKHGVDYVVLGDSRTFLLNQFEDGNINELIPVHSIESSSIAYKIFKINDINNL